VAKKLEFIVHVDEARIKEMLNDNGVDESDINMSVLLGLFRNATTLAELKSSLLDVISAKVNAVIEENDASFDKEDSGSNDYDSYDDSYDEDNDSN
jgi:hypothetical protein